MEFRFNVNEVLKGPIVEIGCSLVPPDFKGDKRTLWDTQSKISQIVNAMGEASAVAQGLSKPITTSERLRNSEHRLYLLIDQHANNGKGAVTGMLKTGEKGLYVFDRDGNHYKVTPPCVLDFYVHESRQRAGLGKRLFEHMLQKEGHDPVKMAIDRPSDKFLGFLNKHYQLREPVKQMNNYVVFDDFFPKHTEEIKPVEVDTSNTPVGKKSSANGLQPFTSSPYGRYAAPRPPCSMGQIIHNDTAVIRNGQEATGAQIVSHYSRKTTVAAIHTDVKSANPSPKADRPRSLSIHVDGNVGLSGNANGAHIDIADDIDEKIEVDVGNMHISVEKHEPEKVSENTQTPEYENAPETGRRSGKSTPGLTEQGFFDLKFYHNKLW